MNACFGDTSYFLALLASGDENHAAARAWTDRSRNPIVTTEYVVLEVGNYLSPPPSRAIFGALLRALRSDPRITIVPASSELLRRGSELYLDRSDKSWSLTDCISFVVMGDTTLTVALTTDHHFEQAGFKALLRQTTAE